VGFYYGPQMSGQTFGHAMTIDSLSNLYVAGTDGDHLAVWKVSSTGVQAWETILGSYGTYSYALALSSDGV